MSQKILMITEQPNDQANKKCKCHSDLFELELNSFSQFFGRLIFGNEKLYRKYFNPKYIHWMHAIKGLDRASDEDRRKAIIYAVKNDSYKIIITFGNPALNVLLNEYKNLREIMEQMRGDPITLSMLNRVEFGDLKHSFCFSLPHPSSQAQGYWKKHVQVISDVLMALQNKVLES